MEADYIQIVQKHSGGKPGRRGCDEIAKLFGQVVSVMEETRQDVLGDLFQGAITYGEAGQFLTPDAITRLMADMSLADMPEESRESRRVLDPCCGSGRMLLSVAERQPHWEFIGQDVDLRCVRMTAINLALRNLYGYVIWGNSLTNDRRLIYRTGSMPGDSSAPSSLANVPRPCNKSSPNPQTSSQRVHVPSRRTPRVR